MAAGAQAELRKEIGPELDELRRQVADLQSLKEIQELRELRDLHPKRLIGKGILGDEFSGGIGGFLGMTDNTSACRRGTPPIGQDGPAVPANMSGHRRCSSPAPRRQQSRQSTPGPQRLDGAPAADAGRAPRRCGALDAGENGLPFDPDGT